MNLFLSICLCVVVSGTDFPRHIDLGFVLSAITCAVLDKLDAAKRKD